MANILFVSGKKSFTVVSVMKNLQEQGHMVICTSYDPSEIDKVEVEYSVILLNAEDYDLTGLVYIKDSVIESGKPILILGDVNQIQDMQEVLPSHFIKKKYVRPFNIKDISADIGNFVNGEGSVAKKKILVVDDSGAVLRNVKGWLEDSYNVILANSGAMAIKYLATNRPDLILLDYEMPICDGKQVLEMIRDESEFADIPVIFLTNKNDKESVLKVSPLRPEGYLLKSMEPSQIIQAIDDFFEKKKWEM